MSHPVLTEEPTDLIAEYEPMQPLDPNSEMECFVPEKGIVCTCGGIGLANQNHTDDCPKFEDNSH